MSSIPHILAEVAHLLPTQGPLEVFVHHNTLHAFEHLPFLEGLEQAAEMYGAKPYLLESDYRKAYYSGRIRDNDLREVIREELQASQSDWDNRSIDAIRALLVATPDADCRDSAVWELVEGGGFEKPFVGLGGPKWEGAVARERATLSDLSAQERWILVEKCLERHPFWNDDDESIVDILRELVGARTPRVANIALRILWLACATQVNRWHPVHDKVKASSSWEMECAGYAREILTPFIVKLTASFLDQGLSEWQLPGRERGFLPAVLEHLGRPIPRRHWALQGIERVVATIPANDPCSLIERVLRSRSIPEDRWHEVLQGEALTFKGFAGFLHLIEHNVHLTSLPVAARKNALAGFMAFKMFLEDYAAGMLIGTTSLMDRAHEWWERSGKGIGKQDASIDTFYHRSLHLFRWAQVSGVTGSALLAQPPEQLEFLDHIFIKYTPLLRRRLWHLAFERNLERRTFQIFLTRAGNQLLVDASPRFQIVTCIDDREESFRRHLEAMGSHIETFGTAGFFGIDAEFEDRDQQTAPFCPVAIKPIHKITERTREEVRIVVARRERLHQGWEWMREQYELATRTAMGGFLVTIGGFLAFLPMVGRTVFPRLTALLRARAFEVAQSEETNILYHRVSEKDEFRSDKYLGFTVTEMADRVGGLFRSMGLTKNFAPLLVLFGHGSSSRNNPFRSAYDCGACGGRPGRINARVFALMANRGDVRALLRERGLYLPDETHILGGFHDTSSDSVVYFDKESLSDKHLELFRELKFTVDAARRRNAAERCRRFRFFPRHHKLSGSLAHVEGRAEHIAEPRPEYGHATNALCIVGRRKLTRGLFLDRRAFLMSYDPTQDADGTILSGILSAVIPVCMGINLEYFFSHVDNEKYGAGTKLPLNITSLIGAMTGYASDLRTGLPSQMVEIHEPVRLIMIIDAAPSQLKCALAKIPNVEALVRNSWVRLSAYDAKSGTITRMSGDEVGAPMSLTEIAPEEVPDEISVVTESSENLPFVAVHHSS